MRMSVKVDTGAIRIFVESEDSRADRPVLVVVRHEKGVLSWQLPLLVQVYLSCPGSYPYLSGIFVLSWQLPLLVQVYLSCPGSCLYLSRYICPVLAATPTCPGIFVLSCSRSFKYFEMNSVYSKSIIWFT